MGFTPTVAEPDIWLRRNGNVYKYIDVYVDDLALAMKNPDKFIEAMKAKFKFKFKGVGPITYHLGMDFFRNEDGVLCLAPCKYIERIMANYEPIFGEPPKQNVT